MERSNVGAPLHEAVTATIRDRIMKGEWNPGTLLPSENFFCKQFSVSRETVRKSLKTLENDGFLTPKAGKGYFVCQPKHEQFTVVFQDEADSSKLKSVNIIRANAELQQALCLPESAKIVEVCHQLLGPAGPVALDMKYLPYQRGEPILENAIDYAVFPELVATRTAPFAFCTRMEIVAEAAGPHNAGLLGCAEGEPLLVIRRYFIGKNDSRIAYGVKYQRKEAGPIDGISGYMDAL